MTRRTMGMAVAALALLLAACGGSSDGKAAPAASGAGSESTTSGASAATTTTTEPATAPGAAVASPGCTAGTKPTPVTEQKQTVDVAGTQRWYLLTAPKAADDAKPQPLIVDYHGLSEGAVIHTKMSGFSALAEKDGFVVAFPQGLGTPVGWSAAIGKDSHGDQAFTTALLDQIEQTHCIDTSRVYAAGLSNGAFMASSVACTHADRFAAVAPVAGAQALTPCAAKRPVPLLTFHGTSDPILLFNGGVDGDYLGNVLAGKPVVQKDRPYDVNGPGYPQAVADWATRNGCAAKHTDTKVTAHVIHRVYSCPAGADVELYIIIGGGHAWPGSAFSAAAAKIVGPTTMEIDASSLIWTFFQRFQLPAA